MNFLVNFTYLFAHVCQAAQFGENHQVLDKAQSFRKSAKFWTKAQDLGTAQDFQESAQFIKGHVL
jgi:hypothetical protein